ncbi:hypothetical protein CTI12_AA016580 (mitochondrion) [Artemisia annua]|uniref:Uncharacterized protein n=1 Tax=Artemisia annua TaxID=35608 RepID=A0A2U1QA02_ARTAN|nr:hypothetical protein CTI12_AA016580 [Artemisia annua]
MSLMTKKIGVNFLCFSLCLLFSSAEENDPSAYEVLQRYNLPIGVLPKGVAGYNLDPNSGQFSVNFTDGCDVNEGGYHLKYGPTITGVITQNNLGRIGGVKVKVPVFRWLSIRNIYRDQDTLRIKIKFVGTRSFPVKDANEGNTVEAKLIKFNSVTSNLRSFCTEAYLAISPQDVQSIFFCFTHLCHLWVGTHTLLLKQPEKVPIKVIHGPLVDQVYQQFNPWIYELHCNGAETLTLHVATDFEDHKHEFGRGYNRNEECLLDKNKLRLERTTNAFHKYEADQTTQGNDGWKQNSYIYGTKKGCDQVTLQLRMDGWRLLSIHGDKSQDERDWVFAEFKSGRSLIMTATHVADLRIMLVQTMEYSVIVFDTALTGHTLRLLQFPSTLEKGLGRMMSLESKFGGLLGQFTIEFLRSVDYCCKMKLSHLLTRLAN